MVMREVGWMLAIGVGLGLPLAVGMGSLIESQLWGLKGYDPVILLAASFALASIAALTGLVPALRASRVSPMFALRYASRTAAYGEGTEQLKAFNIGAKLVRGREFLSSDREGSLAVCLINESFARHFFPGVDPIGKRLKFGGPNASGPLDTIVGVVRDVKARELNESGVLQTYQPMLQHPARARTCFLRAGVEPASLASVVRAAIQSLDPNQVVARFQTMEQVIDAKAASRNFKCYS